tara:strand:- start:21486 stop:22406 length:921 start_codon:yes stop_codon:yes gene_type:complete
MTLSRPPTRGEVLRDRWFRWSTFGFGVAVIGLLIAILLEIGSQALPAMREFGLGFLADREWDPRKNDFGILPQIWGTLYSSVLALLVASVFGLAVAIVISQNFLPRWLEQVLKNVIELLAAIPSVVYGLWGIFVVIPALRSLLAWFGVPPSEVSSSMLPAALVLAIMVLPTITAVARDAIVSVPVKLKEAAYGLGATRWECILGVVLPTAATGIFGAIVLAFGRALGETMALAMLIGNSNVLSLDLLSPGNTLAALLANSIPEAGGMQLSALMYAAVVLLFITLAVNIVGSLILMRANRNLLGGHA